MKEDLIVLTADLNALVVIRAVLGRPEALGIWTGRDSGMVLPPGGWRVAGPMRERWHG